MLVFKEKFLLKKVLFLSILSLYISLFLVRIRRNGFIRIWRNEVVRVLRNGGESVVRWQGGKSFERFDLSNRSHKCDPYIFGQPHDSTSSPCLSKIDKGNKKAPKFGGFFIDLFNLLTQSNLN